MTRELKKFIHFALFFSLVTAGTVSADIKLRVYLKDGTLQAGNFVTETEKSFVILTKTGREEILKDNIMFVNGKTLAQWQTRPDKLFRVFRNFSG
jgi:hypothetical protein